MLYADAANAAAAAKVLGRDGVITAILAMGQFGLSQDAVAVRSNIFAVYTTISAKLVLRSFKVSKLF